MLEACSQVVQRDKTEGGQVAYVHCTKLAPSAGKETGRQRRHSKATKDPPRHTHKQTDGKTGAKRSQHGTNTHYGNVNHAPIQYGGWQQKYPL
jgi:hypothetical protein